MFFVSQAHLSRPVDLLVCFVCLCFFSNCFCVFCSFSKKINKNKSVNMGHALTVDLELAIYEDAEQKLKHIPVDVASKLNLLPYIGWQ